MMNDLITKNILKYDLKLKFINYKDLFLST